MLSLILFLLALAVASLAVLNFHPIWSKAWWFPYALFAECNALAILWWWTVTICGEDKKSLFIFSVFWDVVATAAGVMLPVLVFKIRLNTYGIIGLMMAAGGLLLLKIFGHE